MNCLQLWLKHYTTTAEKIQEASKIGTNQGGFSALSLILTTEDTGNLEKKKNPKIRE